MTPIRQNTVYDQIFRPTGRALLFVAREAGEYARNDPALAMRLAATELVPPIMRGVSPDVAIATDKSIVPIMRTGLLALNTLRCVQTYKNPESSIFDKGMDTVRVVSDTAGFLGGMAMLFSPQYAALGAKLMGTAYAVDIVSHAFRGLTHAGRRIDVWQAEQNAQQNKPDTPSGPPPGPQGPPKPPTPPEKTLTVTEQGEQLRLWDDKKK